MFAKSQSYRKIPCESNAATVAIITLARFKEEGPGLKIIFFRHVSTLESIQNFKEQLSYCLL